MKFSRQRELIYQTVMQNPIHPSADTVYAIVRRELPSISLGTVYRNLNLLSQMGALCKISMPNVSDHFDGRTESHYHVLCEQCGNVFDVEAPDLSSLTDQVCAQTGFHITSCQIHFTGRCKDCASNS